MTRWPPVRPRWNELYWPDQKPRSYFYLFDVECEAIAEALFGWMRHEGEGR